LEKSYSNEIDERELENLQYKLRLCLRTGNLNGLHELGVPKPPVFSPGLSTKFNVFTGSQDEKVGLDSYVYGKCLLWLKYFQSLAKGISRAKVIHEIVDRFMEGDREDGIKDGVQCFKGCSACCYYSMSVTHDEFELLMQHKDKMNVAQLKLQTKYDKDPQHWSALPREITRCTFLKNNLCSIYQDRPNVCRVMQVTSNPKHCMSGPGDYKWAHHVVKRINLEAEIVVTASMWLGECQEPMAYALESRIKEVKS